MQATAAQQGVWFTEQAGVAGGVHHLAVRLRVEGDLDAAALEAACRDVAAAHPALARVVAVEDGVPHLVPGPVPPVLRVTLPRTDPGAWVDAEVRRPIDLRTGPVARFLLDARPGAADLLVVVHHLVFDGTSKDVLVRDLAAAYAARRAGHVPSSASPLPDGGGVPLDEGLLQAARAVWAGRRPELDDVVLPGLEHVPAAGGPGAEVAVALDAGLSHALDGAAARLGATRFELLLGALLALLHRYGNALPTVAIDTSTRTPADADRIDLLVTELPVGPADEEAYRDGFAGLVAAVRADLRAVYPVRAVPLARVMPLRPRPSTAPVSLSYRRRAATPAFDGLAVTVDWSVFPGAAGNALHLHVVDDGERPRLSVRFRPDALAPEAAGRIAAHLLTLLAAALADPDRPLADLPVLPPVELDLVLHRGNATDRPLPADATLPALVAAQVRRTPAAVAVTGADGELTYADLDARTAALAARLVAAGVRPGDLVAVCLPRTAQLVVALLAVARAGAASVPVDPGHPAGRRALILAEAGPRLVVTTRALAAEAGGADVLLLDDPPQEVRDGAALPAVSPGDVAYVMFTSGSTGRPKGVPVPHRALVNLLLAMDDVLGSPAGTWLALTSVGFDISALELFGPLVTGGRVVVAADGVAADGSAAVDLVRRHGVTHVQATPSGWSVLLAGGLGSPVPQDVVALAGGEALSPDLARRLRGRVRRLLNVYGPTETTIWSTCAEIGPDDDRVTVGRPLANTRVYVLDGARRPVPVGLPGELWIGGTGVAPGYLDRPDLTAAAFVPDPFAPPASASDASGDAPVMYRTGDRARLLPDGRIDVLGRTDTQMKLHGHRIELGEIETRLAEHPGVDRAAVTVHLADSDDPLLAAYIVPAASAEGAAPTAEALREHLARWLPAAASPQAWVFLAELPLTPHGKLDRAALPVPERARPAPAPPTPAPPTPAPGADEVTDELRGIWCEVLRMDDVGADEDLFDLGGHSLTITRIIGRIEQRWGVSVPFDDFFDDPTCRGIAVSVRRELQAAGVPA